MKTDIFEDMKERVGCENISDLPYRKRMVWEIIKQHSPLDYPKEQLEKFSHYVFGVDYAVIMGILDMMKGSDRPCRKCESNNTKPYREGEEEYSGAWFNCPVDFEEVREKIGVEHEEQIEIADYELPFDLHSDMPLWEINANCRMVLELEGTPIGNEMKAIQQKWFSSFEEFIDHKDEIRYYDVGDGAALAEYLIREEYVFGEIPHELLKHIDYHSYGSELEMDDRYLFTTSGVFRYQ